MYRNLGEYRIIQYRGEFAIQRKGFDSWCTVDSFWNKGKSLDELKQQILDFRYNASKMRRDLTIKNHKIKYTHP